MTSDLPFEESGNIRTFSSTVQPSDLQWHWDEQDRMVTPLHDTDWKFQFDNKLPMKLEEGVSIFIPIGTWHRLIKGTGDLHLEVLKHAV